MDHSNLAGKRLGKYELQEEIGHGGMGAVYRGYDPTLERYVAIKILAPHLVWQEEFVERFLREARAAARLKHLNIVTIYDVGQEGNWYYFVMEYLEGETLTEFMERRRLCSPNDVIAILRPVAEALDYAHQRGLVHRDIKPANIIVAPEGLVTLTDFGIARAAQETRLTTTGTIVGTPEYISPEQIKGSAADARSDEYSLAVVAYEMLSGQVPFDAENTLALLHKVVYEPPPPIRQVQPDLPAGVEAVLHKALAKEPDDRYATAGAFVDALGRALAGEEVIQTSTRVMVPPPEPSPPAVQAVQKPPVTPSPALQPQPQAVRQTLPLSDAQPTPPLSQAVSWVKSWVERGRETLKALPGWAWALAGLVLVALVLGIMVAGRGGLLTSRILLISDRGGKREIYHLTDDGRVEQITRTPSDGESWTPAPTLGGSILFTSDRDGKREIYHLTRNGESERITRTPGDGESWTPAPMPNGTILFTSDRDGKREIYHLTRNGESERITRTPGDGESWAPYSMPNGTILFTSDRDGKREIYHLTKNGESERITRTSGDGESWASASMPNGSILFTSDRDGKRELYHLTRKGELERVTHTPGDRESWAPDPMLNGTVLFTSDRDGKREIYHLTRTGDVKRVTRTPGTGESWLRTR